MTTSARLGDQRPRRQQQVDPLGDDELADEAHVAVVDEVQPAQRVAATSASRAKAPSPLSASLAASRPISAATPAAASSRGRNSSTSTPGGPSRVRSGRLVVLHRREQRLAGVARADEHPRAPARPSRAHGRKRVRVALDDVLQRAAVHLDRVGHVAAEPAGHDRRPHDEVVGQRHVGPRAGARRRARQPRWPPRRPRSRRRCTPAACAPRRPRSGRRRRRAAGGRCPGATPSPAPARAAYSTRAPRRPPTCPTASTKSSSSGRRLLARAGRRCAGPRQRRHRRAL